MTEKFDAMVCTVGENPLPVYLGIAQLTKTGAKVVLLHSKDTEEEAKRIRACLGASRDITLGEKQGCLIDNPWSFENVRETVGRWADVSPNAVINITGGTNVMTSVGMYTWLLKNNKKIVYLVEAENQFQFWDDSPEPLKEPLSIDILRKLHGLEKVQTISRLPDNPEEAAKRLYELFLKNRLGDLYRAEQKDLLDDFRNPKTSPLFDWLKYEGGEAIWEKVRTQVPAWNNSLALPDNWQDFVEDPNTDTLHETAKRIQFASGLWMEYLVYLALQKAAPDANIVVNQEFMLKKQLFEIDILSVVNNRFYAISVTTRKYHKDVKSKAFEVMHRARQVGGGLAHSIVVSMMNNTTARYCQLSIDDSEKPRHKIIPASQTIRTGQYPNFKYPELLYEEWMDTLVDELKAYFKQQA
jgi:hypothetical protein